MQQQPLQFRVISEAAVWCLGETGFVKTGKVIQVDVVVVIDNEYVTPKGNFGHMYAQSNEYIQMSDLQRVLATSAP